MHIAVGDDVGLEVGEPVDRMVVEQPIRREFQVGRRRVSRAFVVEYNAVRLQHPCDVTHASGGIEHVVEHATVVDEIEAADQRVGYSLRQIENDLGSLIVTDVAGPHRGVAEQGEERCIRYLTMMGGMLVVVDEGALGLVQSDLRNKCLSLVGSHEDFLAPQQQSITADRPETVLVQDQLCQVTRDCHEWTPKNSVGAATKRPRYRGQQRR